MSQKIWFDVLTPKHYLLYASIEGLIVAGGYDTLLTVREYEELNRVLERVKVNAEPVKVGRHGGRSLEGKLEAYGERVAMLSGIVKRESPVAAVSFGSPEASRVAFGLGLPKATVCDSPHSRFVCMLTLPYSDLLLSPFVIPKDAWKGYCIDSSRIVKYRSLDPTAWIFRKELWPPKNEVELLGEGAIIIREEEHMASYLSGPSRAEAIAKAIADEFPERLVILLKRYVRVYEQRGNLLVYGGEFFGPNILEKAYAFIGRGGTMTAEAAILGVPTFSMFPGEETYVDRFLIKAGAVAKVSNISEVRRWLERPHRRLSLSDASKLIASALISWANAKLKRI